MDTETTTKTRKLRKFRVKNPEKLGLEIGKLYKFKGKFRKIYNENQINKQNVSYIGRTKTSKIRKNDFVMFFAADLWRTSSLKKRYVRVRDLEKVKKNLEKEGNKIVEIYSPRRKQNIDYETSFYGTNYGILIIAFRTKLEEYSGKLYVGHGEKFGWININQMNKEDILQQFEKIVV